MAISQDNQLIAVTTPLGKDVLLLQRFSGEERLSRLFSFHLEMISENHDIPFEDIIGNPVTVRIRLADDSTRFINGIIASFAHTSGKAATADEKRKYSSYSATLVPAFWMLTRTADSRIFQNKTVPQIIEQVFGDQGLTDYTLNLTGQYSERTYCVQYRETDFNFISRLMEQEGIFYYFTHAEKSHTLILADSPSAHKPCPHQATARWHATSSGAESDDVITALDVRKEIRPAKITINDYNFEVPNADLKSEVTTNQRLGPGEREIYDYPAQFATRDEGERLANLHIQSEEARITTIHGTSHCRDFTSGSTFTLTDFYRESMNAKDYLLTAVSHTASEPVIGEGDGVADYANHFDCIPMDVPFRPDRHTPVPVVEGTQPAIVVGPSGEEIYLDEFGRVKVQFYWDREGKKDENSSCWIRVSQPWAGPNWGAMFIPRIGQEVIVDFMEGDPDRPIIIGTVYNGSNRPPYELPADKTKSTVKTNSSLGGGGFNEFRFEDKKGEEEIYLQGEKDWNILIKNDKGQTIGHDETLNVANNRTKTVGVDQQETIGSNKTIMVGSNHTETIAKLMTQTVGINKAETIGAAKELTIGAAYQVTVGAAMNESIGGAKAEEIGGLKSVNVGVNSSENIAKNKSVDAGKDVSITAGEKMMLAAEDDFLVSGNKKGVLTIKDQLTIKVGKASLTLKKNGDIIISGKKLNLKATGDVVVKGSKIKEN